MQISLEKWQQLRQSHPASAWVALWYAKTLQQHNPEEYEREKSQLLLTIFDRKRFHEFALPTEPEVVQEAEPQPIPTSAPAVQPAEKTSPIETAGEEIIDNLIEKFSNDPPKIQFNPEIHDENINYGKSSCVENPEIISETLALLYAEQGFVGKAVKIYKKLALHNPEKSCYFADQIKKLKTEIK